MPNFQSSALSSWLANLDSIQSALKDVRSIASSSSTKNTEFDFLTEEINLSNADIWDKYPRSRPPRRKQNINYRQSIAEQCDNVAASSSHLSGPILFKQIWSTLTSEVDNTQLQSSLVDILGLEHLDFVSDLLSLRPELLAQLHSSETFSFEREERADSRGQSSRDRQPSLPPLSTSAPKYPHVYEKRKGGGNLLSDFGQAYALPSGSITNDHLKYEECTVPAPIPDPPAASDKLVPIASLDGLCRMTFPYKTLNRMQSLVYPVAYKTNENMLICAPTGAGKTDVAVLTILGIIRQYVSPNPSEEPTVESFRVSKSDFKIVYVAPMKALAAEVTEKLSKRFSWLGIRVRELTGDMQLTKAEIIETQIIVTTPEKWDVVTRKSTGDTELVQKVRLLIIDEVHMLHDERGAVLESLVARTQRQVESTQSMIRIVGLSATLPNYVDVADFLKVNKMAGMFYFDASFRPVPLEQHFVGVKGKSRSKQFQENLEEVAFDKIMEVLQDGPDAQVMVFVHSRKDTMRSARVLLEKSEGHEMGHIFDAAALPAYQAAVSSIQQSRSREVRELIQKCLGVHHAGMSRADRNLVERLFLNGVIKVLFCTATLAWGVNLPASAVLIKGTQVYSAQAGKYVDLSILDVVQIFGRAGRPQFQTTGVAYILTPHDKLRHYISTVTQQVPIESNFSKFLRDNLNAEISLGTVTSISEGVQWLGYSYLFVRMRKNPAAYGIDYVERANDPQLQQRRRDLIIEAATALQFSQMIIFNHESEELKPKDLGRVASQFYVSNSTVQIVNKQMHANATEADIFKLISLSDEFSQIRFRDSENDELQRLLNNAVACQIEGGIGTPQSKTNVLLQSHISRARLEDFTLVSDMAYVAQNSARICRALFFIALNRRWGHQCLALLGLCKAIEKQLWPFQHPLHQFDLPQSVLNQLEEKSPSTSIDSLCEMDPHEIGALIRNQKIGHTIHTLLKVFPTLSIEAEIFPLNRNVLRIHVEVIPEFKWNEKHHGTSEGFWLWVENSESGEIYHHEYFILNRRKLYDEHLFDFTIPMTDPPPAQIYIRAVSDRWLGSESISAMSFQHLIRPDTESVYTDLLDLQPTPLSALHNPPIEELYSSRFAYFNPMQTQLFHTLYHTPVNVLLGSPTGSGKTIAAELAMWAAFRDYPGSKVVYIAPMKALVRERVHDWGRRLAKPLGLNLVELTGDNTPDTRSIQNADIIVTTPEKWDGISRSWQTRSYVQAVSLVILDEIHLLGGDRGPVLEIIVSRMNYIASVHKKRVRIMGMSTACANALDLASWLRVTDGLFNFRHSIRPVPLETYIDGFPEQKGFCALMQSMNRPTFLAIKAHSPTKPVIVFVPSRRQTRLTARDLINHCGLENNPRRFLTMTEDELSLHQDRAQDESLKESLSFGIGMHHAGLVESDRQLAEELFATNKIQILIATSTLAWGVNLPVHLVVVKGTQYFDAKTVGYKDMDLTDVLQMMGRAGRPQFDDSGVALILTQEAKKEFYKHFLHTGFPVESSLHKVLDDHLGAEVSAGTITTRQDCLEYLSCTFFFRRVHKNPSFYGLELVDQVDDPQESANKHLRQMISSSLDSLATSGCVELHASSGRVFSTPLGRIMSYYYLSHKTVRTIVSRISKTPDLSFAELLACVCSATEYDELPVRHNEDLINQELLKTLPLDIKRLGEALPLWDPHIKAFLLLQAHFSRITMPITDYVGDLNSVLDQSIRIIQATVDILAESGNLVGLRLAVSLLQAIKCARWPEDGLVSIFPGAHSAKIIKPNGDNTESQPVSLPVISTLPSSDQLIATLSISKAVQSTFVEAYRRLPVISLSATVSQDDKDTSTVMVSVDRRNPHVSSDTRMYAPLFPKSQTEGFFLYICSQDGRMLALKRAGWPSSSGDSRKPSRSGGKGPSNRSIKLKLKIPSTVPKASIHLLSDGYLGMEWTTSVDVLQ